MMDELAAGFGANNAARYIFEQAMGASYFIQLVKVVSVKGDGLTDTYVDVEQLVSYLSVLNNRVEPSIIYNLPVFRLQRGNSAMVLCPVVGDIGLALICDNDISNVVKTRQKSLPNSKRNHNLADGVYLGGVINSTPSEYVKLDGSNITINTPGTVIINAPGNTTINSGTTTVNGDLTVTGNTLVNGGITGGQGGSFSGDVVASGISLVNHLHGGVQSGGSSTTKPI